MDVLSGATGPVADARKRLSVDQVGPDAVKRDRGAQPATFDACLVGHPEKDAANDFERDGTRFLAWIGRIDEEGIGIVIHGGFGFGDTVLPAFISK